MSKWSKTEIRVYILGSLSRGLLVVTSRAKVMLRACVDAGGTGDKTNSAVGKSTVNALQLASLLNTQPDSQSPLRTTAA